jgi:N6-L-threonylcarbamoyladenine synthase/protein kinase Bud32
VLGETLDTGVGNALDKVARHVGWSHPGGPKVERAARDGTYVELPYVVKGLDLSFAGLASAAQERYDAGTSVEDVCFALQEHAFASLAEVAERALALTRRDELVLGGGVGANDRLREMLAVLCDRRGASFHAPEPRFLRDNAGMIAVLGAAMHAAGDTVPVADSRVRPDWRPDEPAVTWRSSADRGPVQPPADEPIAGAEAAVSVTGDRVRKRRTRRAYRAPALDDRVRRRRTGSEARLTSAARRAGVPTPVVLDVNPYESEIVTGRVGDADLADAPSDERMGTVAEHLARLHAAGIVHGDPTTRNVRAGDRTWLIDFGLAYHSEASEDRAMDLHVLRRSLAGTVDDGERYGRLAVEAYATAADGTGVDTDAVRARLAEIEGRGRYAGSDAA